MTIYVRDCSVGSHIDLYSTASGQLADYQTRTDRFISAVYLGKYNMAGDQHLLGWVIAPSCRIDSCPLIFKTYPQVPNPEAYRYFRQVSGERLVDRVTTKTSMPTTAIVDMKVGQLSPIHAPGWHQCKCGFRNQDISISAIIGGKYVCYSCRNIWK